MTEEWRTCIESFKYEVSNLGRVRNRKTKKILKNVYCGRGCTVNVYSKDDKNQRSKAVGLMVLRAFSPIPESARKWICFFKDSDFKNCALSNLRWGTKSEVVARNWKNGIYNHINRSEVSKRGWQKVDRLAFGKKISEARLKLYAERRANV